MSRIHDAILAANELKQIAIEQARENLQETITPKISSMLSNMMNEEADVEFESAINESEPEELDEDFDFEGFGISETQEPESDSEPEKEPETTPEEPATDTPSDAPAETPASTGDDSIDGLEGEPEISDETSIADLTVGELKGLLSDLLAGETSDLDITAFDDDAANAELDSIDAADSTEAPVASTDITSTDDDDDDLNLENILKEVESRINGTSTESGRIAELEKQLNETKRQLKESNDILEKVTKKLVETNLLNSQHLYMNKILHSFSLSESQRSKVVANFTKAKTPKEAKAIYEALDLTFRDKSKKPNIHENLGFASKSAGVAPTNPNATTVSGLSEDTKARIKYLAGIK
jgi:hypothetical protein